MLKLGDCVRFNQDVLLDDEWHPGMDEMIDHGCVHAVNAGDMFHVVNDENGDRCTFLRFTSLGADESCMEKAYFVQDLAEPMFTAWVTERLLDSV